MHQILLIIIFLSPFFQSQQYQWNILANPPSTPGRYDDVFFLNENLGWAIRGGNGKIYKTFLRRMMAGKTGPIYCLEVH